MDNFYRTLILTAFWLGVATFASRRRIGWSITCAKLKVEVVPMPTKNPRVNVVLEKPLYDVIASWARRDGISLSMKVREW